MYRMIATTTLIFASAALIWADDANNFQWQGEMTPGQLLSIRAINGSVNASLAPGTQASITVVKSGIRDDPSQVQIQVVPYDGGIVVCAVYPPFFSSQPNTCNAPGIQSTQNVGSDVQVQFTVLVPAGVSLNVQNVNGDIHAGGLNSDIQATTVNGQVTLSTSGAGQAATVNGSIVGSFGSTDWSGRHAFSTVNGSVDVTIPAASNVVVQASTVHGTVSSDFPLGVQNSSGFVCGVGGSANGTIGNGGGTISLSSVNGSVHLRKGQ